MPGITIELSAKLKAIPDIIIDTNGEFNYVICKIYQYDAPWEYKYIVRGTATAQFHSDIYDELDSQMEFEGVICECLGGGKIYHNKERKIIEVFGLSQGYGRANHRLTVNILLKEYSDYTSVTWSDD